MRQHARIIALAAIATALGSCASVATPGGAGTPSARTFGHTQEGPVGRIERRTLDARPRLTLVSRDGDPTPAVVVAVATDLGPVLTTGLAAVVEARLTAAGFP